MNSRTPGDAPGTYRPRTPIFWWLQKWSSARFLARELTSVFVGFCAVLLLFQVRALQSGPQAYAGFQEWLGKPGILALQVVVFLAVLYHTVTWLNLAPRAMVVKVGRFVVPKGMVLTGHYLAWFFATALVIWFLRG
ncbi:MAG: fumarate reductase subunit C [Acidobacteriota bacterium]